MLFSPHSQQKPDFERDEEMLAFGLNTDANFDYQFNQSKLDQAKQSQSEEKEADQSADSKTEANTAESISMHEN